MRRNTKFVAFGGMLAVLISCRGPEAVPKFSQVQLCKAGIASVMGRDPAIMQGHEDAGIVMLSYTRADDQTIWSYRCRVDEARIIWASDTGRWRTEPEDDVITFSVDADGGLTVTQRFSDGTSNERSFWTAQLGS